jgi:molybdopterin-guanine dinucleotide biosynthesis protein A
MGVDKAFLPFGKTTMLAQVVTTVESAITPQNVVIVAAADQQLPQTGTTILRDSANYQGPLAALVRGFESLVSQVDGVFVTGCDAPLLSVAVIEFLFDQLADLDCVVPADSTRLYPLCAAYSSAILPKLRTFEGRSLHGFISTLNSRLIPRDELRSVDPELYSLLNVNTNEDYLAALAAAGLSTP